MLALWTGVCPGQERIIKVGVSIPPQKFLVESIGRDRVSVEVMLQPGQAPETFEPTPRRIASLSTARIYFRIGVPFEGAWLESLQASNPDLLVVECCDQLLQPRGGRRGANPDPHVWVSPVLALRVAELMRRALVGLDPVNHRIYDANYRKLSGQLTRLNFDIRDLLRNRRTSYFIISHDSLGQFSEAYGLTQLPLEAGGRAAAPRAIADIVRRAREENLRTVFVQSEFNSAGARALANELDAEIVEIDPLSEDYLGSVLDIALKLAKATR